MQPSELLVFAKAIATDPTSSEAANRAAVSRAYYGLFHSLRPVAFSIAGVTRVPFGESTHEWVITTLANWRVHAKNPKLPSLANRAAVGLRALRSFREKADYELNHPFPRVIATQQVHSASIWLTNIQPLVEHFS